MRSTITFRLPDGTFKTVDRDDAREPVDLESLSAVDAATEMMRRYGDVPTVQSGEAYAPLIEVGR